jgi:enamine deaminase RidA (YjgF/YER057c/UK114 family)
MTRQRIKTGVKFEEIASYSRALIDGDMIYMSGTVGFDYATMTMAPDAAGQTEQAIANIRATLAKAGASLADVLRIVVYIPQRDDLMAVCEVIGRHFREIDPANTTVCVPLAEPGWKVEIEVTARKGSAA